MQAREDWMTGSRFGEVKAYDGAPLSDPELPPVALKPSPRAPLGSAYAVTKGHAMVQHDFTPGFPLRHAAKDITLALSAAGHHEIDFPLTEAVLKRWDEAIAGGHEDEDVAAAITAP